MITRGYRKSREAKNVGTKTKQSGDRKLPHKDEKLLPNENLKKLPDETYGDTKIPETERK